MRLDVERWRDRADFEIKVLRLDNPDAGQDVRCVAVARALRCASLLMSPAAVSFPASPAAAFTPRISAPVPAWTMPALRVPAMLVSAENKLHLIDQVQAIDGRVHVCRYDRGVSRARQAADRKCDYESDFQATHIFLCFVIPKHCPRPTARTIQIYQGYSMIALSKST